VLCPACEHLLEESTATCAGCGFSLSQADAQFGAVPFAQPRLTDLQNHLSKSGRALILKATLEFEQRFPSLPLTTLIHVAPRGIPNRPYLFWLFNRSGLHNALEKGGANRHIVLWIDPGAGYLAAMLGYGLEPLVPDSLIQDALATARSLALAGQIPQAAVAFIRQLDTGLVNLQSQLPEIFGWFPDGIWSPLEDALDPQDSDHANGMLAY
jgi:hypothetical protein